MAASLRAKVVKRRQHATGANFEDRAIADGPACLCCPVEVPVGTKNQPGVRVAAVMATSLGAKVVNCSQHARGGNCEDRAIANAPAPSCSVEVPVAALNERHVVGISTVGSVETYQI